MKILRKLQKSQIPDGLTRPFQSNSAVLSLILTFGLLFVLGCVCSNTESKTLENSNQNKIEKTENNEPNKEKTKSGADLPRKLESYRLKGLTFSYYLIPQGLSREKLIETAQKLHNEEPDAQLILVDDDSKLAEYIQYCQEFSRGNTAAELPKEWVDEHLIANVQRFLDGKWYLCERNLYEKIAALD